MLKKIFILILTASLVLGAVPAPAADGNAILFSEGFSSFAENEQDINTVNVISGLDARIITDEGNKVLFGRALGEAVSFKVALAASNASKTVMSARIKATGQPTSGKLFNAVFSNGKVGFLSVEGRNIKLYDDTIVASLPEGIYKTVTIVVDWKRKVFCVYADKKCVAHEWSLASAAAVSSPSELEFSLDYNEEAGESVFYADDIRVYEGDTLPWNMSFPSEKSSSEVKDFTPTTDFKSQAMTILREFDFNSNASGLSVSGNTSGQISTKKSDDGIGYLHLYADENTQSSAYCDINESALGSQSKYVIDMSIMVNEISDSARFNVLDGKDNSGKWVRGYTLKNGGVLAPYSGGSSVTLPSGEWCRLSFVYNIRSGKAQVYLNSELISENAVAAGTYPVIYRIDCINSLGSKFDVMIDWIKIYTGNNLMDESELKTDNVQSVEETKPEIISVMDPADKLETALSGKIVFMPGNETLYIDGKKESYASASDKPYNENGTLMISENMLSRMSGEKVEYNPDTGTGEVKLGSISDKSVIPIEKDGVLYFPLRAASEKLLGKKVDWDERGMAVISGTGIEVRTDYHYLDRHKQWYPIDLIYRFMQFDNPSGSQIIEDVKDHFPNKSHPRILWTNDEIDYILNMVDSNDEWKVAYASAMSSANGILGKDFGSSYTVAESGKQSASMSFQGAISSLATAYMLTGETKYAQKGVEIMKGYAGWETMGYQTSNLTSGHWAAAMGIGFDSFYNYMMSSPQGRADLEYIKQRILALTFADHKLSYQGMGGPHWIKMQDNFLGVIGGGLMTLILAVCDEEDMRKDSEYLSENVLKSLYIAAELYYPNGGYFEGVSYSNYMLENFLIALEAMFKSCGTDYGIGLAPGFTRAGDYFAYLQTPAGNLNFHDDKGAYIDSSAGEFMGYRYNDPVQAEMSRTRKLLKGSKFTLKSLFYYAKAVTDRGYNIDVGSEPLDRYFYSGEAGGFRSSFEVNDPTFVGFHGGWTNIPHDMLDLGEFVFAANDVMWAVDLGSDSYSLPGYFSDEGYYIYRKRPEGENCLVLNPQKEVSGYYGQKLHAFAELVDIEMNKPKGAKAAYDLTDAYSRDASKYIRGYYFGDDRNTLIVQDELTLKGDTELYWFMHTPADIEIVDNNKAILTKDGKTLTVDVYCSVPGFELKKMDASPLPTSPKVDGQNPNEGITKLAIHHANVSGDVVISVKLSPDSDFIPKPFEVTPISEWTIPDGEVPVKPTLTAIYLNGELIENFLPGKRKYIVELPYGTEAAPNVTAVSDTGTVSVKNAANLGDTSVITIQSPNFKDIKCEISYTVSSDRPINVTDELADASPVVGTPQNLIKPITASGYTIPEPGNGPDKVIDGDLTTRYAQDGTNMWFEFDLGEVMDISGIAMAFYDGDIRQTIYDLLYSEDGTNFKRVFSGRSTGKTEDYETLAIPGRARYIRVVGFGNTAGSSWNSITEFRVFK